VQRQSSGADRLHSERLPSTKKPLGSKQFLCAGYSREFIPPLTSRGAAAKFPMLFDNAGLWIGQNILQ
jgi:hypothetical protein